MLKLWIVSLCLVSGLAMQAQNREIHFVSDGFNEALKKAEETGKLLFLDCQTSWCGPCKFMAKNVFTVDSVADFFNAHFICLKMDMEVGEGENLKKEYQVEAYPTFLLIDSRWREVFRLIGQQSAPDFLRKIREGMKPENSIVRLSCQYEDGDRDAAFIYQYCGALKRGFKDERLKEVTDEYFEKMKVKTICRDENWKIYEAYIKDVDSPIYRLMIDHIKEFKALIGSKIIEDKLAKAYSEKIFGSISGVPLTEKQCLAYVDDVKKMELGDEKQLFYLSSYLQLACLRREKKYDEFLDICEGGPEGYEAERKQTLAMSLLFLADGTREQRQRGEKILLREAQVMMAANGGKLSPNINQVMGYVQYKLREGDQVSQRVAVDSSGISFPIRYQNEIKRLNALYPLNLQNVDSTVSTVRLKYSELVKFIRMAAPTADSALLLEAEATVNCYSSLLALENTMRWIVGKDTILPASYYSFVKNLNLNLPIWRNVNGINEFLTSLFAAMERNGYLQSDKDSYLLKRAELIGDSVVCENYLIYALQRELMGYHQNLPEVIARVKSFIRSKKNQIALEDIRRKHRLLEVEYVRLNAGEKAADLSGRDKNGKKYSLKDYVGKVVVIDVWSTNCLPCIAEMSYFRMLKKQFENEDVVFIFYSVDLKADRWKNFIETKKWDGIQLLDTEGPKSPFVQYYAIHTTPRLILIGRDGKIADSWGAKPSDPLLGKEIESLLKK